MARIMFAWECGGGLGHLSLYSELIDLLSGDGHDVVFAAQQYHGARLIMSGSGFVVPPHQHPFQAFPIAPHLSTKVLLEEEQSLLDEHVNPLVQAAGGSRYERLCDAFKVDARWLCQFAETDHYPNREVATYIGTGYSRSGESPVWPTGQGGKMFDYLKPHKDLVELLNLVRQQVSAGGAGFCQCSRGLPDRSNDRLHVCRRKSPARKLTVGQNRPEPQGPE